MNPETPEIIVPPTPAAPTAPAAPDAPVPPSTPASASTPASDAAPPIDDIIQAFLKKAYHIAQAEDSDPKEVCALGWLVLKIKEHQLAGAPAPKVRVLTTESIRQIEDAAKML